MRHNFQGVLCLLEQGVEAGYFPGAALAVGYQGDLVFEAAVGYAALVPAERRVTLDTVFDLASLTKAIATTTALMRLVEAGQVRLDAPISAYVAASGNAGEASPTIRQLLGHCGGLPSWQPYYRAIDPALPQIERRRSVYDAVHHEPLIAPPATIIQYSDVGFILLGELVETVTAVALDAFCKQEIFQALQLGGMGFVNLVRPRPVGRPYASTEACRWRARVLEGEVHDENAWIMGGVAGHAGLFATAREVWHFAHSLLAGLAGKSWLVSRATLQAFTQRQLSPDGSTRALGWDTPTPGRSSAGRYFSPTAIGHLGFTGTSLWIDPVQDVIVVLLTNRVHPSRQREGIKAFRPSLHDAVMQALQLAEAC
jgi:CubicO group peptidase (beta-lactamase class C family)